MWKKEKYMFNFLGMWKNFEGMREVKIMKKIVHRFNAHKLKANCLKIKTKFKS